MTAVLHSSAAQNGARHMEEKLNSGRLMLDVLPNSFRRYSGELENQNHVSFCTFLKSRNGRNVLSMLDEEDELHYGNS